jgi:hypothetical protein
MKTTLFTTVGAIVLTSLAFTLTPTSLEAKDHRGGGSHGGHGGSRGSHGGKSSHCSTGRGHGSSHCSSLPRGCRPTRYRGERCWYGGGNYYRCAPQGGYVICEQPIVQRRVVESYVEEPTYVEEPAYEEEEVISYLPTQCTTVYVGGERCWYRNGCYYRHSGRGYSKFHCGNRGSRGSHCSSRRSSHCSSRPSHCSSRGSSHHNSGHSTSHHSSGGHKGGSSHGRR